ncbi:MAG TPA: phage holin family protein [Desulfonatronum sp.]|nr:phage holin family protein [Desulfonatronum sp.]
MKGILIRWLILTAAVLAAAYLVTGIQVNNFFSALAAAAVLGILNALLRPLLVILTLPITVLTLGLFLVVINALLLMMASGVVGSFHVAGFGSALLGSLVISIVGWLLNSFVSDRGRVEYVELHHQHGRWE